MQLLCDMRTIKPPFGVVFCISGDRYTESPWVGIGLAKGGQVEGVVAETANSKHKN